MLNEIQQSEFVAFETYLKEFAQQQGFALALKIPYVDKKIEQLEEYLEAFMKDDGYIDGRLLSDTVDAFRPNIANFINFPRNDFRMVDLAKDLTRALFGG